MKKIGYLRVSTQEQRPDRQIEGLRSRCDELHLETLSAVSPRRPIYEAVLARLEPGDALGPIDIQGSFLRLARNQWAADFFDSERIDGRATL